MFLEAAPKHPPCGYPGHLASLSGFGSVLSVHPSCPPLRSFHHSCLPYSSSAGCITQGPSAELTSKLASAGDRGIGGRYRALTLTALSLQGLGSGQPQLLLGNPSSLLHLTLASESNSASSLCPFNTEGRGSFLSCCALAASLTTYFCSFRQSLHYCP